MNTSLVRAMALVDTICSRLGTQAYVWGGWIPDIYTGKILRPHDDVDYLVIDLYDHITKLGESFHVLGWEQKIVDNGDLVIKKNSFKLHFGHVEIQSSQAIWFHNGAKGKVNFPDSWLNPRTIPFQGARIRAVKPQLQYVLKLHPEYLNSDWQMRVKDKADLKVLRQLLVISGIGLKLLEKQMRIES